MTKRRWICWSIPYCGGLYCIFVSIILLIKKVKQPEPFEYAVDGFIGVSIWFCIQKIVIMVLTLKGVI